MEIPYTVNARRDTGLFNAKIGIWLFLASEVMLFGGLFSAYVFLRTGVREGIDPPWPNGTDVHGNMVYIGFVNTLVLIASSVFVVMAWAQLKLRNYGKYQLYMLLVLLCAAIFMVNKGIEYNAKLNHHFGVFLTDGALIDGGLAEKKHQIEGMSEELILAGDELLFRADEVDFALVPTGIAGKADPHFLDFAVDGSVKFDVQLLKPSVENDKLVFKPEGELKKGLFNSQIPPVLDAHIAEIKAAVREDVIRRRKMAKETISDKREELANIRKNGSKDEIKKVERELALAKRNLMVIKETPVGNLALKVVGTPTNTSYFRFKRKDVLGGKPGKDAIAFFRGNGLRGELIDDSIALEVHTIDMQMVRDDENSLAWNDEIWENGVGHSMRAGYLQHKAEQKEKYREYSDRGFFPTDKIFRWPHAHPKHETGGEDAGGDYAKVTVPGDLIRRSASHAPRFAPYYAIYFTMTALHGLHVVGGAIVLGFFAFFGRSLYKKNPEHLANRVEVGGLFWHFVDLIWIFLFPLYYLM